MCGALHREPRLAPRETAQCSRCGSVLLKYSGLQPADWLALCATALILFLIANLFPVAELSVQGQIRSATLPQAVALTWAAGNHTIALLSALFVLVLPVAQVLCLVYALIPLARRRLWPGFVTSLRMLGLLRPWSMIPVFVLAVLVALVKMADLASVQLQAGMLGYALASVCMTMLTRVSPHLLWRLAESRRLVAVYYPTPNLHHTLTGCHHCGQVQPLNHQCVRCSATLHHRKPESQARPWALLLAALVCYLPANLLPIMQVESPLLGNSGHTILGGVLELGRLGSWDLAAIVFIASVVVPLGKLLALACLLLLTQARSMRHLRARTRLYRVVEFVGQWSMLDVFVVLLLAALAHFSGLMVILVGPAAAAFGLVVILTMLAAMSFDPRTAWDRARDQAISSHSPPPSTS